MTTVILAAFVLISIVLAVFQAPAPNAVGAFATGENMAAVGALALYLGIPVQGSVDLIKGATGASGGKLPLIGVFIGWIYALGVQVASGTSMTMQIVVLCFFAGLSAELAAMAANTLKTKAEVSRDKSEAEDKKGL